MVSHPLLLTSLQEIYIRGYKLQLFKFYLGDRRQLVKVAMYSVMKEFYHWFKEREFIIFTADSWYHLKEKTERNFQKIKKYLSKKNLKNHELMINLKINLP